MSLARILAELGGPEIYYAEPRLFERLAGWKLADNYGGWDIVRGVHLITVNTWVRGWAIYGTEWHEVGHDIHPSKEDWYLRIWGWKMAHHRGGLGPVELLYGHDVSELPGRAVLLEEARRIVERRKAKAK